MIQGWPFRLWWRFWLGRIQGRVALTRSTIVALLLIALGFLAQPSEDRFGYLMGVAWLAIVYGCHQLWEARDATQS